jgi:sec-independent protein translocase protein TatB
MFNLGAGEIAVICVLALLLLGPERLPELARGMGRFFREFRKQTDDVRSMVEREFYKMDQDVLEEAKKKEPPPALKVPSLRSLIAPALGEATDEAPRILPTPSFPAFPAPEGVVASRPPEPELHPAVPPTAGASTAPADGPSSDINAPSDAHPDVPPGRDA